MPVPMNTGNLADLLVQRRTLAVLCLAAALGCESAPTRPPLPSHAPHAAQTRTATQATQATQATHTTAAPETPREARAGGLRYLELVRGSADPDARLPLVVFLHGRGDHAHAEWIDGLELRARFIFPEAPTPFGGGFSWFPFPAASTDPELLARSVRERAAQLAEFLAALERARPTHGKPIVAGFSQGAMLTFALALLHPERLALGLPIAGMIPDPLLREVPHATLRHPPLRVLHGKLDDVIAYEPTARAVQTLRERGLDVQLRGFDDVHHQLTASMQASLFGWLRDALR
jgi:phospholipase/carboxylesterase